MWALKWSFAGLFATALVQFAVVAVSGSVALLADTIHNFADAATAIPLWFAFAFARLKPTRRYLYGSGRVEDLASLAIVATILMSAAVAGYESVLPLLPMDMFKVTLRPAGCGQRPPCLLPLAGECYCPRKT